MSRSLRIAVLECDTPIDWVKTHYGTYGDRFATLMETTLPRCSDGKLQLSATVAKYDAVGERYPALHDLDGILITGSKFDAFADTAWILSLIKFVQSASKAHIPIVGVCFGHQIIARAMGASVGRSSSGWEISVNTVNLTEVGSAIFGKEKLSLHQMHRDIVSDIPEGFQNLGHSPRCSIQGLWKRNCVLSLQAHPEFDDRIMQKLLEKRHADGVFDDTLYEEGLTKARLSHDGLLVMTSFLKFFIDSGKSDAENVP